MLSIGVLLYSLLKAQDRWSKRLPPLILFLSMIYFGLSAMDILSFEKRPLDIWLKWVVNSYENPLSLLLGLLLRWVASYPEHYIVSWLHGRFVPFEGGRNSRVFSEKFFDKFITKFGEEFSESPNSSPNLVRNPVRMPNLVTNSVTYFVRNVVAHLYLHQF